MYALHVAVAGEQPQLGELPTPQVKAGHVLVKVKAAGLNPVDNALASGMMSAMLPHEYPLVLGRDAAGVVEAVGDGVEHVKPGDEVFGHLPLMPPIQAGTLAEYVLLPEANVAVKPAGIDFVTAAALPLASAAAVAVVEAVDPQSGDVVLVNGATGGVGSYAVQLLTARGVTVVATGTEADIERLITLGATAVVDYTGGPVVEQVRHAYPDGIHGLINLVGHTADDVPLGAVAKGGKVASTTGAPDAAALAAAGLTGTTVFVTPARETMLPVAEEAAAGALTVEIDTVLPLKRAIDGLATLAAGKAKGKIVVSLDA